MVTRKLPQTSSTRTVTRRPSRTQSTSHLLSKASKPTGIAVRTGLIFSATGTGKTSLLASASEKGYSVLDICSEGYDETLPNFPKLDVIDFTQLTGTIYGNLKGLVSELGRSNIPYNFIFMDSVSKFRHLILKEVVEEAHRTDQRHDPELAEQRDHQRVSHRLSNLSLELRMIAIRRKFHLVFTGWERSDWIEDSANPNGAWFYYPDLPPELLRIITHDFGFCCRMIQNFRTVRQNPGGAKRSERERIAVRTLLTHSRDALVKNKVGLPARMENPTIEELLGARVLEAPRALSDEELDEIEETVSEHSEGDTEDDDSIQDEEEELEDNNGY